MEHCWKTSDTSRDGTCEALSCSLDLVRSDDWFASLAKRDVFIDHGSFRGETMQNPPVKVQSSIPSSMLTLGSSYYHWAWTKSWWIGSQAEASKILALGWPFLHLCISYIVVVWQIGMDLLHRKTVISCCMPWRRSHFFGLVQGKNQQGWNIIVYMYPLVI